MSSQVVPFRLGSGSTHAVLNTVSVQEKKSVLFMWLNVLKQFVWHQ